MKIFTRLLRPIVNFCQATFWPRTTHVFDHSQFIDV